MLRRRIADPVAISIYPLKSKYICGGKLKRDYPGFDKMVTLNSY